MTTKGAYVTDETHRSGSFNVCPRCGFNLSKVDKNDPCPGCKERQFEKPGKKRNRGQGDAVFSLYLALFSIPLIVLGGIGAVIISAYAIYLGFRGQKESRRSSFSNAGPAVAYIGIVVGFFSLSMGVLATVFFANLLFQLRDHF